MVAHRSARRLGLNGVRASALAAACVLGAAVPAHAFAQGNVTGRVTMQERPGDRTTDLGNTVIYLLPADSASVPVRPARSASIAMNARAFVPRVRVVTPGGKVEFPNQDPFSHNIFSTAPNARFDLGLYGSGRSRDATFRRAGAFPVYCNIHPRMTAFIVVVPTPYYALAGNDGRYTVEGVPPGRYTVTIWHERALEQTVEVEVGASGRSGVDAVLDARGFRFAQHKNKFGQEYDRTGRDRY